MHRVVFAFALLSVVACSSTPREPRTGVDAGPTVRPRTDAGPVMPPPFTCSPGVQGCDGNTLYTCGADGRTKENPTTCETACSPGLGCTTCRANTRRCDGTVSQVCARDGASWTSARDCAEAPWNSTCGPNGFCNDACGDAESSESNVGCEYWATPLANTPELSPTTFDFRIVLANPGDTRANVTVTRGSATTWTGTVDPGGIRDVALPWVDGQSFAISTNAARSLTVGDAAYRVVSDQPVIVSQFNPFEYNVGDVFSYTNDATLLLPTHTLTGDYVGASYVPLSRLTGTEGGIFGNDADALSYPGYIAIVGVAPEPVRVEVRVTGAVAAGPLFPATPPGGTLSFEILRGQVVHIVARNPPDCRQGRPGFNTKRECMPIGGCEVFNTCEEVTFDLTGSRIHASGPVEVFGGHVCAYVPYTAQACDHLEEIMPPLQTWGREFASMPMNDGGGAPNAVRVVAAFDDTTVTVEPAQNGFTTRTLQSGEWVEFRATGPFRVSGSEAILVAQYTMGQYLDPDRPAMRGDPGMTVLVPEEQYRADYTFILPTSYNAMTNGQNYVLLSRPPAADLVLDGVVITATWQPIGGRELATIAVDGGTHTIRSRNGEAFGLIEFGLGSFTSYAALAGLNLKQITTVPLL
ncbi:MAG: IgGFc-binding protein [Kofleriaceae bacterium]|nr:IgGFc-binding protein [Kofleriaceae bacterium]